MNIPDMPLQGFQSLLLDDGAEWKALCSVVNQSGRICVSVLGISVRSKSNPPPTSGVPLCADDSTDRYSPWQVCSPPLLLPVSRVVASRAMRDDDPIRVVAIRQQREAYQDAPEEAPVGEPAS